MNNFEAVALYTGLNLVIALILLLNVIRHRRAHGVSIGDGGHPPLILAIRAHSNAIETMSIGLVGLLALALTANATWPVHAGGLLLTIGRAAHGYGMSMSDKPNLGRMVGMFLTLTSLVWIAVACILSAF
jgi:uncharacterized protein